MHSHPFERYMKSTVFIESIASNIIIVMITTTNNHSEINMKHRSIESLSFFGAFQDTAFGSSDVTMCTIVSPNISAKSYRKTMIAIIFFVVFLLSQNRPLFSLNDLTATITGYLDIHTVSAERGAERIFYSIRQNLSYSYYQCNDANLNHYQIIQSCAWLIRLQRSNFPHLTVANNR